MTSKQKAVLAAKVANDNKAEDIAVLDMRKLSNYCDYFVICSAASTRRALTIAEEIREAIARKGVKPVHEEGKTEASWILLDYSDVVVHVFISELRTFYNLEHLWNQATRVKI